MLTRRTAVVIAAAFALMAARCQAEEPVCTIRIAGNESFSFSSDELDEIAQCDEAGPSTFLSFSKEGANQSVTIISAKPLEKGVQFKFSFGGGEKPVVKKIAENLYERREKGIVKFILIEGKCALISESRDLIEQIRPRAEEYQRMEQKSTLLFVETRLSQMPAKWKNERKSEFAKRLPGTAPGKGFEPLFHAAFSELINDCDTISFWIDFEPEVGTSKASLKLTAIEGSSLDKSLKLISPVGSRFCGQMIPNALLNIAVATDVSESVADFLTRLEPKFSPHAVNQLKQKGLLSQLQSEHEELSDATEAATSSLLRLRRLDAVLSWYRQGSDLRYRFCAFLPGSERIDAPLAAFLKRAREIDATTAGKANVSQHGVVPIHLFGPTANVALFENTVVVANDEKLVHQTLDAETSAEMREKTPAILIEGDAISIASLLPDSKLAALENDPARGEERFRLGISAQKHALTAELSLDRALTARLSYYGLKQIYGPLTPWLGFGVKPATKPKRATQKPPATVNPVPQIKHAAM